MLALTHALAPEISEFFDRLMRDTAPEQVLVELRRFLADLPGMTADEIADLLRSEQGRRR